MAPFFERINREKGWRLLESVHSLIGFDQVTDRRFDQQEDFSFEYADQRPRPTFIANFGSMIRCPPSTISGLIQVSHCPRASEVLQA